MPAPTPRTPPVTSTTPPLSPKLNAGPPSAWVTVLAYQASACLGNRPPRKWSRISMTITSRTVEPGIVAVTVDFPPVNAIPSRGWFELGGGLPAAGNGQAPPAGNLGGEGRGFNAGVDIKEMQRTE